MSASSEEVQTTCSADSSECIPIQTAGGGDCAFHAVLGDWDAAQQQFVCVNVVNIRQQVASKIIERKYDEPIFSVIREAIQELIISREHIRGKQEIEKLRNAYKKYCSENQEAIDEAWQAFEKELIKHPQVMAYITGCMQAIPEKQRSRLDTLRLQFQQCLDMHDDELYGRILSIESLDRAFKEYNRATTISFDLDGYLRNHPQVIEEYANLIIERQGQWLLPCELALIAYALGITIEFYTKDLTTRKPRYIDTYNTDKLKHIKVCFNGVNHYERMDTSMPSKKYDKQQPSQQDVGTTLVSSQVYSSAATSSKVGPTTMMERPIERLRKLQHHLREPFCFPKLEIKLVSPISTIANIYTNARTLQQKQACLRYLLHYQHYNAEYTIKENEQLGYPIPLCASQELPGYFRTEYNRLLKLFNPYINNLKDFFTKSFTVSSEKKIKECLRLSTASAIMVLKTLFSKTHQVTELQDFVKEESKLYDLYLMFCTFLPDLSQREVNRLPVLVKTTRGIYVYGRKTTGDLGYTQLDTSKFDYLPFPDEPSTKEVEVNSVDVKKNIYDEIKFKGGHTLLKNIVIIRISPRELTKNASDIIKEYFVKIGKKINLGGLRTKYPDHCFLFLLEVDEIDCSIMWGAKWARPKKDDQLQCLALNSAELFGEHVFTMLNTAGAVPDRIAINQLLTSRIDGQEFAVDLKAIGIHQTVDGPVDLGNLRKEVWREHIKVISSYTFEGELGCLIYRDAILKWQEILFATNQEAELLALPLLYSQVMPWMTDKSTIIQWAKAYQNLCEILFFCFDYLTELTQKIKFDQIMLDSLDPKKQFTNKSFGLYSYAMSAIFDVFYQILNRMEFKGRQCSIACISQNYFETIELIEWISGKEHVLAVKADSLEGIQEIPSILVADIHPNNAAKEQLFENDIAVWVEAKLKEHSESKIILILDVTLNYLTEPIFQNTIDKLKSFIVSGQLEIFGIQSLAKLVQLGADNFSGGACFYLGKPDDIKNTVTFSNPISQKAAFFGLLAQNVKDIIARYFDQVRQNSGWMYDKLRERFSSLESSIWIEKNGYHENFYAVGITLNVDEGTVYVAINFMPLFNKIEYTDKAALVKRFHKLILELCHLRGLPLVGRQSFGFSLSNISNTGEALRFSIGVESQKLLAVYSDVIIDFSFALSKYVANDPGKFDINYFEKNIKDIYTILQNGQNSKSIAEVSLQERIFNEYGDESFTKVGSVSIFFKYNSLEKRNLLCLQIQKDVDKKEKTEEIFEPKIGIEGIFTPHVRNSYWTYEDLFQLFFQLIMLNPNLVFVIDNTTSDKDYEDMFLIDGFLVAPCLIDNYAQIHDEKSGISIVFEPKFSLTLLHDASSYTIDDILVRVSGFGSTPVKLSKLNSDKQSEIFDQCLRYYLKIAVDKVKHCIFLEFTERKPWLNYIEVFRQHFKDKRLIGVVDCLNRLDFKNLPLLEEQHWWAWSRTPLQDIHIILQRLGCQIIMKFKEEYLVTVLKINDATCKSVIIESMFKGLFENSLHGHDLNIDVAGIICKAFSDIAFQKFISGYFFMIFKEWIQKLNKYMTENPRHIERLRPYFVATFPLIQYYFGIPKDLFWTSCSAPLYNIAKRSSYDQLSMHMRNLESKVPASAVGTWKDSDSIKDYLKLYIEYPLSSCVKQKLVDVIKKAPVEILKKWITSPGFYYYPLDSIEINMAGIDDCDLILGDANREAINEFFQGIECKSILLWLLYTKKDVFLANFSIKWSIMTQDQELFTATLNCLRQVYIGKNMVDNLQRYIPHLDKNDPIQKELIEFLRSLTPKNLVMKSLQGQLTAFPLFKKFNDEYITEHRHESVEMQQLHDKRLGLIIRTCL